LGFWGPIRYLSTSITSGVEFIGGTENETESRKQGLSIALLEFSCRSTGLIISARDVLRCQKKRGKEHEAHFKRLRPEFSVSYFRAILLDTHGILCSALRSFKVYRYRRLRSNNIDRKGDMSPLYVQGFACLGTDIGEPLRMRKALNVIDQAQLSQVGEATVVVCRTVQEDSTQRRFSSPRWVHSSRIQTDAGASTMVQL
jgi:hypothetical protein